MPKIHRLFKRTKRQYELWLELQDAIDGSPIPVPCTNFPDLFFPDGSDLSGGPLGDIRQAQKLCKSCPIMLQCATYGIEAEEAHGVWGGLTAYDRKRIKQKHGSTRNSAEALVARFRQFGPNGLQGDKRKTI